MFMSKKILNVEVLAFFNEGSGWWKAEEKYLIKSGCFQVAGTWLQADLYPWFKLEWLI